MKTRFTVILSVLAGITIGAVGVLHAQGQPPVYFIAENDVTDPDGVAKFRNYAVPGDRAIA